MVEVLNLTNLILVSGQVKDPAMGRVNGSSSVNGKVNGYNGNISSKKKAGKASNAYTNILPSAGKLN